MKYKIIPSLMVLLLSLSTAVHAEPFSKDDVLAEALKQNPRINAALARIQGAEGTRLQAGLIPNPKAAMEIEEFAGDGPRDGFDGAEGQIRFEQEIEIAGKRQKRKTVADYQARIVRESALAQSLRILAETDAAFMNLAIAQERLKLAEKRLVLANKTHKTVKERVSAAAASDIQHTKADIELSAAELEKRRAQKTLAEARTALDALMAGQRVERIQTDLDTLPALPAKTALLEAAEKAPQARAAAFMATKAENTLALEQARAVPNPSFELGVQYFNGDDSTALVAGVSFPLPVFNRNQGNIDKALAGVNEARSNARQQTIMLRKQAIEIWEKMAAAYEETQQYQNKIIPSAQRAYTQASKGYSAGRYSFLDLLDAQRTLFKVREARLDGLLDYHEARAQSDFLMGVHTQKIENKLTKYQGDIK